jgi:hypothetical protein
MTPREHLMKHDREIAEIRALIKLNTEHIGKLSEHMGKLARAMRELAAAQKRTEAALAGFISRTNGHSKRKIDLG